ncbi:DUF945 family protein [Thioalkalivibrio sp.]|uniref:DUF945 family protein n=1 Tax=Thioalkalivibrio sp. TaxID=2093813 RepID=UPI0012D60B75|nr:DUF945 family protein [Thioalkalivibrio sp.]TVP82673.1 MAG: DUF945 family protein [Thioalkalivibrio sp.]
MRKILILCLLLVLAAAAWPVYVGVQVETALRDTRTGQLGGVLFHHSVADYHRDNYRARATTVLHVVGGGMDFDLHLDHRIRHRLLGAVVDTRLAARQNTADLPPHWRAALAQAQPRADSWLGLGGGVSSRLSTRPVQVAWTGAGAKNQDGRWLEIGAGQGGLSFSPERLVLSFDTETLRLYSGRASLLLDEFHYGVLVHPGPEGLYGRLPDYDLGLGAGRLSFQRDGRERFGAESLQMSAWQNSTLRQMNSLLRLRAKEVRSADLELEGLDLHLSALRWHRPTVMGFIQAWEGMASMELDPQARTGLVLGMVLDGLQQMIAHDPRVLGGISVNSDPDKWLRVRLDLGLQGDAERIATRPLEALDVALDLEVGRRLLEELDTLAGAPEALHTWLELGIDDGWIEVRDNELSSRLRMDEGRLLINDSDQTILLLALVFALGQGMF